MNSVKHTLDLMKEIASLKSQKSLASALEVSESYITKWKNQGYIPSEYIELFENKYGKLIDTDVNNSKFIENSLISVNFYPDVYCSAGGGATNGNSNAVTMKLDKSFLESLGLTRFKNLDMIRVSGDSMEPFIQNGETIILERDINPKNNEVIVANINGQVYIKRYEIDPFKRWIKLKSENSYSGDILLETKEEMNALVIIGIVRAKMRPF